MTAGMVGYFPEGVFYGPQIQEPTTRRRPSCCSSAAPAAAAISRGPRSSAGDGGAQARGRVQGRRVPPPRDVQGKRNVDGYQAIWEHVNDRPMVYPKPRYPQPILMDPPTTTGCRSKARPA